jgi:diguanylate cyclase (GGDEF)-like protein
MAAGLAVALEQGDADELLHPALYDTLTGLPGRVLFQDRLDGALARSSRRGLTVAVLSCDLAGLQAVNDRYGHDAGDGLLRVVAERLALFVRPGDTVTRFGGDEFVVLCEGVGGRDDATALARRLVAAVTEPADLGIAVVQVAISVGVALGTDPVTPEALLEAADGARARAKATGRGIVEVVDTASGPADEDAAEPAGSDFSSRFAA